MLERFIAMKNTLFLSGLSLLVVGFIISLSANAKMYKWVDENGQVQYTQSPPPGDIEVKEIKPPPKVDTDAAQKALEAQKEKVSEQYEKRMEAEKEAEESEQKAKEKEQRCNQAKQRLASFQRPRVNLTDENGNPVRATEEQRLEGLEKARKYISENCN